MFENYVNGMPGWVKDEDAVKAVLETLPYPIFGDAAAHLAGTGEDKTVLLYKSHITLFGKHLPANEQQIGSCVSHCYSRAVDYLSLIEILNGDREEFKSISHSAIYGMARELGGMLGGGDGLVGAYASKCVNTLGVTSNEFAQDSRTDDRLARTWGSRGAPREIKEDAKKHLIKTVSLVATPEEARDAICNGYPIGVCSGQGFTMQRDSEGRCRPQGSWAHAMMWSGYDADKRRFCVEQSWGQNTPSGPTYLDQPDNSFWIDWDVAARMLRERDSFSLGSLDGWPAQKLPRELFVLI